MFGEKESDVFTKIRKHLEAVEDTLKSFREMFEEYINGNIEKSEEILKKVEKNEGKADDLRREIELMLYAGAFIPANRGDYIRLSELVDNIADAAESAAHTLIFARPNVPEDLKDELVKLVEESLKTFEYLKLSVLALESDVDEALRLAKETEVQEESADKVEYAVLRRIFSCQNISTYAKLIWNQVVTKIGDIADRAEDASDHIMLMAVKRR
ncbi:TIGR00153 family protein [Thermococcus chitonophagus]|uniref:Phosphate transport regulator (Distant homolog of PhoU) n=1 Tax=Thermococcus chitonophagus TaxID=54262 RepID=A0A160VU06_9EURY|nr:TIGR00153 family protein [Thermococcus chitonophagus]ASJ16977.1 TIGR00153 family protein [Thermococcus chitonophagus]CUX78460.1 Phosphate transport regulator (distant homolog of PhoU) [Thermococcus chitonophagus]